MSRHALAGATFGPGISLCRPCSGLLESQPVGTREKSQAAHPMLTTDNSNAALNVSLTADSLGVLRFGD